jgi:hypothetical protein
VAIVAERLAVNVPSAIWWRSRLPVIRSQPTVTDCAHHPSTPYSSTSHPATAP